MKLTIHLYLVLKLMCGSIPRDMSSWCGAYLSTGTTLPFSLQHLHFLQWFLSHGVMI
jgi:hypothetical protein